MHRVKGRNAQTLLLARLPSPLTRTKNVERLCTLPAGWRRASPALQFRSLSMSADIPCMPIYGRHFEPGQLQFITTNLSPQPAVYLPTLLRDLCRDGAPAPSRGSGVIYYQRRAQERFTQRSRRINHQPQSTQRRFLVFSVLSVSQSLCPLCEPPLKQ